MSYLSDLRQRVNAREEGGLDDFLADIDTAMEADSTRAFEAMAGEDPDDAEFDDILDDIMDDDEDEDLDSDLGEDTNDDFDFANEQFNAKRDIDVVAALEAMIGDDNSEEDDLESSLDHMEESLFDADDDDSFLDEGSESLNDLEAQLSQDPGEQGEVSK